MPYQYGGIFDYLQDIHFPHHGQTKIPNIAKPWFWYHNFQQPLYFSTITPLAIDPPSPDGRAGMVTRAYLPVIKLLAIDTQPIVKVNPTGWHSLEEAADAYVAGWDAARSDKPKGVSDFSPEWFGRWDFNNKFMWKVLGQPFPKWATGLQTGLYTSNPKSSYPPIGPYVDKAIHTYMNKWNNDALAYNAVANAVGENDFFTPWRGPLSFAVPYPPPGAGAIGIGVLLRKTGPDGLPIYWFGAVPPSAYIRILQITTQAYSFTFNVGQLDDNEWDLSQWPPRRTSIPQRAGGSGQPPSALSHNYHCFSPFQSFYDHCPGIMAS